MKNKKLLSLFLTAAVAVTMLAPVTGMAAENETTWASPTSAMAVDNSIAKVGIHAAASTTAFFLGGNVIAERASDYNDITKGESAQAKYDAAMKFTRLGAFGSSSNVSPDPYLWNYFYNLAVDAGQATGDKSADEVYISAGAGSPMSADVTVIDSLGTSYTLDRRPEVLMDKAGGYADLIAKLPENTDSDKSNDYNPVSLDYKANNFADLSDDMYNLSDAIKASGKVGRYGDTDVIAQQYEAYMKGLQYYLLKQIDEGKIAKKNVAVITSGVDTNEDGKSDSYVCVNNKIVIGTSTDRPAESIMYTTNNILDLKSDLGTAEISTTSRGQTTTSTETVATLAQLAEMDAIIFGGHVTGQADTLVSEMKAAGISEDKIPPIYDNDPSDVFTIRANSVENFAGIGIYNGWLYPQVINPVNATMYIYDNFWHLKDSELKTFAQANFAAASLPAGITTDGSNYDEAAIDKMISEGLAYGYHVQSKYADTTLELSDRLTNYASLNTGHDLQEKTIGSSKYYECSVCHEKYLDEKAETEITDSATTFVNGDTVTTITALDILENGSQATKKYTGKGKENEVTAVFLNVKDFLEKKGLDYSTDCHYELVGDNGTFVSAVKEDAFKDVYLYIQESGSIRSAVDGSAGRMWINAIEAVRATGEHDYSYVTAGVEKGHTGVCSYSDAHRTTADHVWGEPVTTPATYDKEGEVKTTCEVCGQSKTEIIPKLTKPAADKAAKKAQPMKVTVKAKTVKASKVKKAKQVISGALTVKKAQGTVTYKKASGSKNLTVASKTGKITVKKGTKKGTYKIKVKVSAKGNSKYKSGSVTKTVKVTVK